MKNKVQKIIDLFNKPGAWGQGRLAVNSAGVVVNTSDPQAVKFCLVGAIFKLFPDTYERGAVKDFICGQLKLTPSFGSLIEINDAKDQTCQNVISILKSL